MQAILGVGNTKQSGRNAYAPNGGGTLSCNLPTSQRPDADVDDVMSTLSIFEYYAYETWDINMEDDMGLTVFHHAVRNRHSNIVNYLLDKKGAEEISYGGDSLIFASATFGNFDLVKLLISRGGNVNEENSIGQNPLHIATSNGYLDITCDMNKKDHKDFTSVHGAVLNGHLDVLDYLIAQQAKIKKYDGKGVLHLPAIHGHLDILQYFMKMGADANELDDSGQTPLHLAAGGGHLDVEKYLISISTQNPWRTNPDSLSRPTRGSCAAKPKTQLHGGGVPANDDFPITSENDAVDPKPGITSKRRSYGNCISILTLLHQVILALAFFFACSPILVAGNLNPAEPFTFKAGTRGVVTFCPQWPSSTVQFSLFYTIQFGSKGRPFCINGQYDVDAFKDHSQESRFTTTVIDRDTSLCVNMTIDDVDTIDGDQYIFVAVWHGLENVPPDTQKKDVVVQLPPGRADCFITLSDSEYPYEVHCWAKTGSMPTTLTCYQNERDLVMVHNITHNGHTNRAIFLLSDTTHFSCCSHAITSTVGAATCNDFEWPPGYSGISSTEATSRSMFAIEQSNRPTDPTPLTYIKSDVGSGVCRPSMIPSQWHFQYLLYILLHALVMHWHVTA